MNIFTQILGWVGVVLTSMQLLPQLIKIIKTKKTRDLSLVMLLIQMTSCVVWLLYSIFINNPQVIVVNSFILMFATSLLILKLKNKGE